MANWLCPQYGLSPLHLASDSQTLPGAEDKKHVVAFQLWFQNLTPAEREESLIVTHRPLVQLLCQMHLKKLREGDGVFSLLEAGSWDSPSLEDKVYFHRSSSLEKAEEWEFEKELRVFDVQSYSDSLTVTETLSQGTLRLLELAAGITEGKAFFQPCRAVLRPDNQWLWDLPEWFNASYFSLSQLALALLEQSVWKSYWKYAQENPCKELLQGLIPVQTGSLGASGIKQQLVEYWKTLKKATRTKVLGDFKALYHVVRESKRVSGLSEVRKDSFQAMSTAAIPQKHYSAQLREREQFEQFDSLSSLSDMAVTATSARFLSVLFFSPLHRSGTTFDQVCRQLVIRIRTAYTLHEATSTLRRLKREREEEGSSSETSLFIQDPVFHQESILEDE